MVLRILLISLALAAFNACSKTNDSEPKPDPLPYPLSELPLPTQEGKGTFGCVINGEPWVSLVKPSHPWVFPLRAYYDEEHYGTDYNRRLILGSNRIITSYNWNKDSISNSLGFTITPINGVGYYDINSIDTYSMNFGISKPSPSKSYTLDTLAPFHIQITKLDTIKKIVSGTFEMDLRRTIDSTEILEIRHGRFDALYQKE